jgi:hypothetical protein
MKKLITSCLALAIIAQGQSFAKCANYPLDSHVEADVKVFSCVSATLGGSDATFYSLGPMYPSDLSISGSLLGIRVTRSRIVQDDIKPKWGYDARRWKVDTAMTLFVHAPTDQVCPKDLPSTLTVIYREKCCDTLPMRGMCIVPGAIYVVELKAK